ncbi:YraN family protein [Microbacterium neungamense]|uniref:YraN family protein n=1 Tax=Microbacterium neungamense TaxID=2810535 RepID=UPI00217EA7B6|nr:YraN family protein [Microbacterium neungamense]UWF78477.1 YraN family protein [Microbacterium neungamense]
MAAKDDLGRAGEDRAAAHLDALGYDIIDRNWRCPQGEIDIVARIGGVLAVVEVKTRRSESYGHPFEAIDARKRRRLWQLAYAWAQAHPDAAEHRTIRLEAIGLTGRDAATARLEHLVDLL